MNTEEDPAQSTVGLASQERPASQDIDPCDHPHAQEALRLDDLDEACDDGSR